MPLISVIIPIYKVEKYLRQCVDSVINQSFKDLEVILVDDGSPDGCPQICDEYREKDDRIKVIHKENGGLSDARNAGIEIATGKYLMFLDSDDWWQENGELEKIAQRMQKEDSADLITYNSVSYNPHNNNYYKCNQSIEEDKVRNQPKKDALVYLIEKENKLGAAWTSAVKNSVIKENNIRFMIGVIAEDYDWNMNLIRHIKTVDCVKTYLVVYRKFVEGSITQTISTRSSYSLLKIAQKWKEILSEEKIGELEKKLIKQIIGRGLITIFGRICSYTKDEQKDIISELKKYDTFMKMVSIPRYRIIYLIYKIFGHRCAFYLTKRGQKSRRKKIHGE